MSAANNVRPLAGLKVVDLSWVVAGPLVGRALPLGPIGQISQRLPSIGRVRIKQPLYARSLCGILHARSQR